MSGKYATHGFVLLQHIMDNLFKDTDHDGYNCTCDNDLNSQIAQVFNESVIINVLLFGGSYTMFN